jgi:DNA invertase Pin-like site-specific DNA recombinase
MQHAALKQAGCKTIFTDELPGATTKRPALLRCLKKRDRGDTLIVWKLDRLGPQLARSYTVMLDNLKTRGIKFQSLTEAIDVTTLTGRASRFPCRPR